MCFVVVDTTKPKSTIVVFIYSMEYPLPGPVVALLQQEKASFAPKSYFISSGKKSIKITLVYSKGEQPVAPTCSTSTENKMPRHSSSSKSKSTTKPTTRRTRSKNLSESSSSTSNDHGGSISHSDLEQARVSPVLPLHKDHKRDRERMSTADSGHPSSSGTIANDHGVQSDSASEADDEVNEQVCDSLSSSDSEKPRTPGREIAVPASSIGPGETPAARRDEMWQTWTRIPRTQASSNKFLAASLTTVRRSLSPSPAFTQTISTAATQRRPRLHEGVSWDGSGNL